MAQRLKRLPAMWETWVRSLGQEDPLGKEMATHSSSLAWRIPWTEEPGGLPSMGSQRVRHFHFQRVSDFTFFLSFFLRSFSDTEILRFVEKISMSITSKRHII